MTFILYGAVELKALISKGVTWSIMVSLEMSCLDHYPVILDLKSFSLRLNISVKIQKVIPCLNCPPMFLLISMLFPLSV